jgi:ribosomal protein S7
MARKGLAKPVGSMTQYDKIRVGRGAEKKYLHYGEIVPLAELNDLVFGAWDVYPANAFEIAVNAEVLRAKDILPVEDELKAIVPMKAAFDKNYASRLDGDNVKDCKTRWEMAEALRQDIREFKAANGCERVVVIWAASTEIYVPIDKEVHYTLEAFEAAMENVMPVLEVKSRRVGGSNYQVPMDVRPERRQTLGLRWITAYSRSRGEKTMKERLAAEIMDAMNGTGNSVKKRDDVHKMAEANKAFAHFRW